MQGLNISPGEWEQGGELLLNRAEMPPEQTVTPGALPSGASAPCVLWSVPLLPLSSLPETSVIHQGRDLWRKGGFAQGLLEILPLPRGTATK